MIMKKQKKNHHGGCTKGANVIKERSKLEWFSQPPLSMEIKIHSGAALAKVSFSNYVDQILAKSDLLTPLSGHFTTTCNKIFTWPSVDFLLTTYPPHLVHVVIEWPKMLNALLGQQKRGRFPVIHLSLNRKIGCLTDCLGNLENVCIVQVGKM